MKLRTGFSVHGGKAVRTRCNFGQVQRVQRKSCPNSVQLRTGSAFTEGKQSELGSTSDRFSGYRGKAVRTQFNFGQVQRVQRESCPNSMQLRTGSAGTEEKLSELDATSDRFQRSRRESCPNSMQLRTGSAVTEGKLSELDAASDRFSGYRRKAVRTQFNFETVSPDTEVESSMPAISTAGEDNIVTIRGKEHIQKDNNAQKVYKIKWACPVIGEKVNCQNYL
ncbi:hypothetical protein [Mesobacillus jeotgali]|uniref:Uncharacterized protein n=1 Tax=Mesobacillus jeotgali TaxID=129985 RepID=A0ABY9VJT8_9BACI|nr:hypothetical protein [Mesobacillus jeotgali]WNF23910.1 hypothetical protein RH061_05305 [Mesobacillus jeotgali]